MTLCGFTVLNVGFQKYCLKFVKDWEDSTAGKMLACVNLTQNLPTTPLLFPK